MTLVKRRILWTGATLMADLGLPPHSLQRPIAPVEGVKIYPNHVNPGDLFVVRAASPHREPAEGPPNHPEAVAKALFRGAVAAVTDQDLSGFAPHAPILKVPDLLETHYHLGKIGRARMTGDLIGVTGSVGKTTTKDLLHQTLSFFGLSSKTDGNLNGVTGVTSTLASMSADHRYAVVELATSYPDTMAQMAQFTAPDLGILTNIGDAHLENFGTRHAILAEKINVLRSARGGHPALVGRSALVVDRDGLLGKLGRDVLVVGTQAEDDIQLLEYTLDVHRTYARIRIGGQVKDIVVPSPGVGYAVSACFVLGTGLALGLDLDEMIGAMQGFQHPNVRRGTRWRLNLGPGFAEFIDDTQNSAPVSMMSLVEYLTLRTARRKILVMGDMMELGEDALAQHLELAPALRKSGIDHFMAVGPLAAALGEDISSQIQVSAFTSMQDAMPMLKEMVQVGDLVAAKGAGSWNLGALRGKIVPPAKQVLIRSDWVIEDIEG